MRFDSSNRSSNTGRSFLPLRTWFFSSSWRSPTPVPGPGSFLSWRKTLPKLAKQCDRCFLPPLGDVDEGEADGWVDDNEDVRYFLIHELGFTEGEVRRHIHEAFKDAGIDELPMADLEPSVRGRLKDAYRSRQALQ